MNHCSRCATKIGDKRGRIGKTGLCLPCFLTEKNKKNIGLSFSEVHKKNISRGIGKWHKQNPLIRDGENNGNWKGGKSPDGYGYIQTRVAKNIREREHRIISEKAIGRKLKSNEVVHHVNGNPADNRNQNLLICSSDYHPWLHSRIKLDECEKKK